MNSEQGTTTKRLKHWHCENNNCPFYVRQLKKGVKGVKQRWKILSAHLEPGSFVDRTRCPNCGWVLRIGLMDETHAIKVEKKKESVLDILKKIPNAEP